MILKYFDNYIASADASLEESRLLDSATVSGNGDTLSPDDTAAAPGGDTPTDGGASPDTDSTSPGGDSGSPSDSTSSGDSGTSSEEDASSGSGDSSGSEEKENAIQEMLDGLREELSEKDDSIDGLSDSLRSFMSYMIETEELKAEKEAQAELEAQAEMEAQALAAADSFVVIFPDYEAWDYPVYIEYTVYPWGAGYYMDATQTCDTPEDFVAWYDHNLELCQSGGTLKEFYVRYVTDCSNEHVYDYQAGVEEPEPEEPEEDLTPAILETLQSIDARLEIMGVDISTISENTLAYYDDMRPFHERDNNLQSSLLVTNITVGFLIVVLLGYTIAHGFWQRMRVG